MPFTFYHSQQQCCRARTGRSQDILAGAGRNVRLSSGYSLDEKEQILKAILYIGSNID